MIEIFNHKYSFPKLLTWGFLAIILLGTILLSLPIATRSGRSDDIMTAFFTSSSDCDPNGSWWPRLHDVCGYDVVADSPANEDVYAIVNPRGA